jgi:DNA-binding transcriptional ArsR family regulator
MVTRSITTIDLTFTALGHATRRAILERLRHGPTTVGELAAAFTVSRPAITKHLDVLAEANLVSRRKAGRERICELQPETLQAAAQWLERYRPFWASQFDALENYLRTTDGETSAPLPTPVTTTTSP